MADVAARAGVSRALVSLVFRDLPGASDATRARVKAVAAELGYRPHLFARRLAGRTAGTVGVCVTMRNPFHWGLVECLYAGAAEAGMGLLVSGVGDRRPEHVALEELLGLRCDGYILLGSLLPDPVVEQVAARAPVVVLGQSLGQSLGTGSADVVRTDDRMGVELALDYLWGLGHRRIGHLAGASGRSMAARRTAYEDWMRRRGLAAQTLAATDTEAGGRAVAAEFAVTDQSPTALLAANDRCALGLLDGLATRTIRVPADVSVVGFDDIDVASLGSIGLTTVRQDVDAMAAAAWELLRGRLDDRSLPAREVVLDARLQVRTTAAPPAHRWTP